ncbi:MAG: prepilin-type N-terminal cleavage/methylation domain-containing protein [Paracoccaceae bacterium]
MLFLDHSDDKRSKAGYSIFEVLVVLSILTLVIGIVVASAPGQNRGLRLEQEFSALQASVAGARFSAVSSGNTHSFIVEYLLCGQSAELELRFYPDGTTRAATICLEVAGRQMRAELNPLTGRINRISQ